MPPKEMCFPHMNLELDTGEGSPGPRAMNSPPFKENDLVVHESAFQLTEDCGSSLDVISPSSNFRCRLTAPWGVTATSVSKAAGGLPGLWVVNGITQLF